MGEIFVTIIRYTVAAIIIGLAVAAITYVVVMGSQAVGLFTTIFGYFAHQVPAGMKIAIFAGLAAIFSPFAIKFAIWAGQKFV